MASREGLDMTTGPIFRKLLIFAYPLIINSVVNTFYGFADQFIAGQYIGDTAIAAVGACTAPFSLIIGALSGISAGVGVLCGNFIGAHKQKELRECMHCTPVVGLLFGVILCVMGLLCGRPLLVAMETPDSVLPSAVTYMTVRMLGMPIEMVNSFSANIFTAHGDTRRITVPALISGLVNVIGNIVFVTIIPLGIAGIALATVLSPAVAIAIRLSILFSPKQGYRMRFKELRLYPKHLKQIVRVGLPSGINSVAFSFSNVILQSSVNSLGATVVAGNAAADTICSLVTMVPLTINSACSCAVAQCFGAGNFQRIKETVRKGLIGTIAMIVVACTVVTVFSMPLMRLFTDSTDVAKAGIPKLMFSSWGYVIYIFVVLYAGALTGMRHSGSMMARNIFGVCIPRVMWVWFVFPLFASPNILYMIYPVSYLISAVLMYIAYHRTIKKLAKDYENSALVI